ncbi:hypothetical protein VaNZ11_011351, partial [Volvox africanus]
MMHRRGGGGGGRRGGDATAAAARFFSAEDAAPASAGFATAAGGSSGASAAAAGGSSSRGCVTLMLFDEVDVLPEEDKGFLGALVSIIQESKRPIILTAGPGSNLSPQLRALGLQNLVFHPAPEPQLLRTVAMVCAASRNSSCWSHSSGGNPSGKPAAATLPPCVLNIRPPDDSAAASEREVLDLSGDVDRDDVDGDGFGRNAVLHPRWRQQQQQEQLLLPSLLSLVRSCHGDLRHALLKVQFWLGGNGSGGGGGGGWDSATMAAARLGLPYWGGQADAQVATSLVDGDAVNGDVGDDLEVGYCTILDVAWQAVQDFTATAATAAAAVASVSDSTPSASVVGFSAAGLVESQDVSESFACVLPRLRLWLPGSTSVTAAAAAATSMSAPKPTLVSEPRPSGEDVPARDPAGRRLQWQLYGERCKRLREQQLAARWLELEVARAATRISRRRKLGFGAHLLPAEVEAEAGAELGVGEGNGVACAVNDGTEAVETMEAVEVMEDSSEESSARLCATSQTCGLVGLGDKETGGFAERRREMTGKRENHHSEQQQRQQQQEGDRDDEAEVEEEAVVEVEVVDEEEAKEEAKEEVEEVEGEEAKHGREDKAQEEVMERQQHQHQNQLRNQHHFPQKRRAAEAVEEGSESGGVDCGNTVVGQSGGFAGVKRSRLSVSSSQPASKAATPRDSLPTTTAAA